MELYWTSDWDQKGNAYGYSRHTKMMKKYLTLEGVTMTEDAEIAVHIVVPPGFEPVEGKFNVLFTMYEGELIPDDWIPKLEQADLLVVPCEHNKRVFAKYYKGKIEVCPEGIEPQWFPYIERKWPEKGEPFRFLWVGASNPRKGWEHLSVAWSDFWKKYPEEHKNSLLIMKTTQVTREERVVRLRGNVIMDTRDYSAENLLNLYSVANAFIFPTMGEGWGLTLTEACATGLPAIYTPYSGVVDFMDPKNAYPLKYKMKPIGTMKTFDDGRQEHYFTTVSASADVNHLVRRIVQVYHNYQDALDRGRRMSEIIHRQFTWQNAAKRFIEIIEGV